MAFHAESLTSFNFKSKTGAAHDPCHESEHSHNEDEEAGSRRVHRLLLVFNIIVALLLVANLLWDGNPGRTFLSGFFDPRPVQETSMAQPLAFAGAPAGIGETEAVDLKLSSQTLSLNDQEEILTQLYESTEPAVVKVMVARRGKVDVTRAGPGGDGVGSGIILDLEGYIVTNHHVIKEAADVAVQLANGQLVQAEVLGQDPFTDLAVLHIDAAGTELAVAPFADSDEIRVGQVAIAIGHPFGLDKSLTVGHISGLGRVTPTGDKFTSVVQDMIQTDAAINPGNSGGPLFNLRGEVVGINTSIFSTSRGSQGVGFAVPSNVARQVIAELLDKGYVARPFLGIAAIPLNSEIAERLDLDIEQGLLIQDVLADSAASAAGLQVGKRWGRLNGRLARVGGDVLIAFDGQPVVSMQRLNEIIQERTIGDTVTLTLLRDGETIELDVTLNERPKSSYK